MSSFLRAFLAPIKKWPLTCLVSASITALTIPFITYFIFIATRDNIGDGFEVLFLVLIAPWFMPPAFVVGGINAGWSVEAWKCHKVKFAHKSVTIRECIAVCWMLGTYFMSILMTYMLCAYMYVLFKLLQYASV